VGSEDFTFGTTGVPTTLPAVLSGIGTYQTNNAELTAILMDLEKYPNGAQTVNFGHVKNPQKIKCLNLPMVTSTNASGIGIDGIARDPWGNPYFITIDLNNDEKTRDWFYSQPGVSADPADTNNPKRGLNGLIPTTISSGVVYEAKEPVMVWSAGPDKQISTSVNAKTGVNKDNVLSWAP
jgi:hypothetical protein